jgi:hypothetical protein
MIPASGNVTSFGCPAGSQVDTRISTILGGTVTAKTCLETCTTQSDCRWNAVDSGGECGQYQCVWGTEGTIGVCRDPRT